MQYFKQLCPEVINEIKSEILNLLKEFKAERILDIGCWDGEASIGYSEAARAREVYGIDINDEMLKKARQKIKAYKVDLEREQFPFGDNFFDVIICNQVFEHIKNIFLPMDEMYRVLKPEGHLIFSVPNLASLHNRFLLLFGLQPTCVRPIGPHIRGLTFLEAKKFVSINKLYKIEKITGCGFYPFTGKAAKFLSFIFPSLSHTTIILAKKNDNKNKTWLEIIKEKSEQTSF